MEHSLRASGERNFIGGVFWLHLGDFVWISSFVVRDPLANLVPIFEMTRPRFRSVFSKPLPVPCGSAILQMPYGPYATIFMVLSVRCRLRAHVIPLSEVVAQGSIGRSLFFGCS